MVFPFCSQDFILLPCRNICLSVHVDCYHVLTAHPPKRRVSLGGPQVSASAGRPLFLYLTDALAAFRAFLINKKLSKFLNNGQKYCTEVDYPTFKFSGLL